MAVCLRILMVQFQYIHGISATVSWNWYGNTCHRFLAPGIFSVTLTVTDNLGASASDSSEVTVKTPGEGIQDTIEYIKTLDLFRENREQPDRKIRCSKKIVGERKHQTGKESVERMHERDRCHEGKSNYG